MKKILLPLLVVGLFSAANVHAEEQTMVQKVKAWAVETMQNLFENAKETTADFAKDSARRVTNDVADAGSDMVSDKVDAIKEGKKDSE